MGSFRLINVDEVIGNVVKFYRRDVVSGVIKCRSLKSKIIDIRYAEYGKSLGIIDVDALISFAIDDLSDNTEVVVYVVPWGEVQDYDLILESEGTHSFLNGVSLATKTMEALADTKTKSLILGKDDIPSIVDLTIVALGWALVA